ncbi:hypothetical protein BYT27DRAFT_7202954 [Phlegmacium glaucopus]|nr:hypothetical protein BYT27DRAFT_7202954 [Phlegmacium glaucopus]
MNSSTGSKIDLQAGDQVATNAAEGAAGRGHNTHTNLHMDHRERDRSTNIHAGRAWIGAGNNAETGGASRPPVREPINSRLQLNKTDAEKTVQEGSFESLLDSEANRGYL